MYLFFQILSHHICLKIIQEVRKRVLSKSEVVHESNPKWLKVNNFYDENEKIRIVCIKISS